jgi:hypothetical protein
MTTQNLSWSRVLIEGLVIVGSILLAFGIDAWWEGRQERSLERQYAERLRTDLVADTLRFTEVEEAFTIKLGVVRDLLEAEPSRLMGSSADDLMTRLNFSRYNGVVETHSATFREMEGSGSLRLLDDVTLRSSLTEYYAFHETLSGILAEPVGRYIEVLAESMPGDLWYAAMVDSTSVAASDLERGLRRLLSHPELESMLNAELSYATELIFYTRRFEADAKALLRRIDELYP